MPAMDYKGATGVRARSDLTANALQSGNPRAALTHAQLLSSAQFLTGLAKLQDTVILNRHSALRIADALFEAAHVLEGRP